MNAQLKNRLLMTGVFAVLWGTGIIMNSHRAAADPPDGQAVRIVSPLPVPVTGSLTTSGTVAATQSGPWNVAIAGNSQANALWTRDADNPARHAFVLNGTLTGPSTQAFVVLGVVPQGQRYVIEQYSAFLQCRPRYYGDGHRC
jgi:hypothetical protein